jgi:hypothetical protein
VNEHEAADAELDMAIYNAIHSDGIENEVYNVAEVLLKELIRLRGRVAALETARSQSEAARAYNREMERRDYASRAYAKEPGFEGSPS